MAKKQLTETKPMLALRKLALSFPQAYEGVVCNKASYKAGTKGFVFVGMNETHYNVMVKLRESVPQLEKLAATYPQRYKVGKLGWVTLTIPHDDPEPIDAMTEWVKESFQLLAPKSVREQWDGSLKKSRKTVGSQKPVTRKAPIKKK